MIITFARLQRLSRLERPTAIKRWLQRQGVRFLKDAEGNPFTTLEAVNERLRLRGASSLVERPDYSKVREAWSARRTRKRPPAAE